MNVAYLVKVPIAVENDLRQRLTALQIVNSKEVEKVRTQIENKATEVLAKKMRDLVTRGRMITMANLLRVAMRYGTHSMTAMKDEAILQHIAQMGVLMGRRPTKR